MNSGVTLPALARTYLTEWIVSACGALGYGGGDGVGLEEQHADRAVPQAARGGHGRGLHWFSFQLNLAPLSTV